MRLTHKHGLIIAVDTYSRELLDLSGKDKSNYVVLQVEIHDDTTLMEIVKKKLYFKEDKPNEVKRVEELVKKELSKNRGRAPRFPGDIPNYNGMTQVIIDKGELIRELNDSGYQREKEMLRNL